MWENIPYYVRMDSKPLLPSDRAAAAACAALLALGALALIAGGQADAARLLVFAPAAEEIVFRAGLQEALQRAALGAPLAVAATALVFAAAHVALRPGLAAALTLLPALACGALYARSRRVAPCIALHSLFNAVWLLATTRAA